MKEIRDILQAFDRAQKEGKRSALATVVHVEGSSYRRPGARMLITEDGALTGAISGGCLEGDALRKALLAIHQQQKKLVTYDTLHEDDLLFGVQLGCNGIVHILFEPIDIHQSYHPIRFLRELSSERREAVLVTLFSLDSAQAQPGTCLLYKKDAVQGELPDELRGALLADVEEAFHDKVSHFKEYTSALDAFIEFIPAPPALVIAGAGNDILPLVEITSLLGWESTVVDGRPHYATRERFAKADKVLVAKPGNVLSQLSFDDQTIFLLMSHNYNYDLALLEELAKGEHLFIGVLGPRKKLDRMLDELRQKGVIFSEKQLATLHGPVGLDIGAETAQEIAVSIVAEIKAILSGGSGRALKEKRDPIHHQPALYSHHE